jgi:hypothetical protein
MSLKLILKILDIIIMSSESSTSELNSPTPPVVKVKAPKVSISKKVVEKVIPDESIVDNLTAKLKNTNNIKYIVIGVLLLGAVVYYVYTTKYKKDTNVANTAPKQLPKLPVPKQNPSDAEVQTLRRQLLLKQEESEHLLRERQQLVAALERERMNSRQVETMQNNERSLDLNLDVQEKPRRKLKHPNDDMDDIQAGESPQVAQHNLTQAEMEEISKKLNNLE